MKYRFIALLTDFGEDDFFVASLKGVIFGINPLARIVDITHRVPSFDTKVGSFILFSSYKYFPHRTIFLIVIDPGVGSSRRILLVETKKYFFIAPDNGVLSQVLEEEDIKEVREVTQNKFFLQKVSQTFEGRDKMAPVAAWLSKGILSREFGPEVSSYKKLKAQKPLMKENEIIGHIIYMDKFGNLITNIPLKMLSHFQERNERKTFNLQVGGKEITSIVQNYSSVKSGEFLCLEGSLGLIEVAAREVSAKKKLKVKRGDKIKITLRR